MGEDRRRRLSPEARAALGEAALRLRAGASARLLWERVLTPEDRDRLGGLEQALLECGDAAGVWARLRGVSAERAVVEAAWRLGFLSDAGRGWLVRELGEAGDEAAAAVRESVAAADLVLVPGRKEVYWRGRLLEVDWARSGTLWDYVDELCRAAAGGRALDGEPFGKRGTEAARLLTTRKARLKNVPGFPPDLHGLIVPAGHGAQRLDLPPGRVRVVLAEAEV